MLQYSKQVSTPTLKLPPTPDLPVELWLEILSYLPPYYVTKLVGVNRVLFELALDYHYEEMRLLGDDRVALRRFEALKWVFTFSRYLEFLRRRHRTSCLGVACKNLTHTNKPLLRNTNIGGRVRHLYLRPTFLPGMDEIDGWGEGTAAVVRPESPVAGCFTWTKHLPKAALSLVPASNQSTHDPRDSRKERDPTAQIFEMIQQPLACCNNLREVSIVVYDHHITPSFASFLEVLWGTLGAQMKKLAVHTTARKLPTLLVSIATRVGQLPNIESLDLVIVNSRFGFTTTPSVKEEEDEKRVKEKATQAIVGFVSSFSSSLGRISISTLERGYDLSGVFHGLAKIPLPRLRKFELWFVMCDATLRDRGSLRRFLQANGNSLEELVLRPRPKFDTFNPERDCLGPWLLMEFSKVELGRVRTLDVGLVEWWSGSELGSDRLPIPKLVPQILPSLRVLVLNSAGPLYQSQVKKVLSELTNGVLEGLEVWVCEFTPELVDTFAGCAPNLQHLSVTYTYCPLVAAYMVLERRWVTAYDQFSSRRYPKWALKRLRVSGHSTCGEGHPDRHLTNAVAQSVMCTREVEQDVDFRCLCYHST